MNHAAYRSLIEDTLSYVKGLLPFAPKRIQNVEGCQSQDTQLHFPKKASSPEKRSHADAARDETAHEGKDQALKRSEPIIPKKVAPPPPEETKKGFITLEWPKMPPCYPTEEIRKRLKEIDPTLYFHGAPPSDHEAKRVKKAWREKQMAPAIPLLFQGSEHQKFVQNIAKAIDTVYGSCRLVEATPEREWDLFLDSKNLKLIIAPDTLIFSNKKLLPFYQAIPKQKKQTLGKIPLLLLPDLGLYHKDPYLKRSLWNVICSTINSLPSS